MTYPDSSFIIEIYHPRAATSPASTYLARHREALLLTPVQDIEVRNAMRLFVCQRRATPILVARAMAHFERDVTEGIYALKVPDWTKVFELVEKISGKHTEQGGHRFADLLHVACALNIQAKVFLSFDQRQSGLARILGMKTPL